MTGDPYRDEVRQAEIRGAILARLDAIETNIARLTVVMESAATARQTWHAETVGRLITLEERLSHMEDRLHALEKQAERLRNTNSRQHYIANGASAVGGAGVMAGILKLLEFFLR